MGRLGKKPPIDWQGYRRESRNIPDFVKTFTQKIKDLPRHQRAQAYADVLKDIDPALEPRIQNAARNLTARGLAPADALRLATESNLKARRGFLFKLILGPLVKEYAHVAVQGLMDQPLTPAQRAKAYKHMVSMMLPMMRASVKAEDAKIRLEETHLPPWFIDWALHERSPMQAVDIKDKVDEWIKAGKPPLQAMEDGLILAMREYTLDNIMAMGVASGVDFCGVAAAVIAAIVGVASIAVGIAVPLSMDNKNREAAAELEREQRDRPLSLSELVNFRDSLRGMTTEDLEDWAEVEALALQYLDTYRYGRDELQDEELVQIRDYWEDVKAERFEEEAATREEEWALNQERLQIARAQARGIESQQMLTHLSELDAQTQQRRRDIQAREEEALTQIAVQRQEEALRLEQEAQTRRRSTMLKVGGGIAGLAILGAAGYYAKKKFF